MEGWVFFQNSKGLWQWRCTSADGNVVLTSAEAYPLRSQAVAEAITRGFVECAPDVDSKVGCDAQQVAVTDLDALKLNYTSAYSAYESRVLALSQVAPSAVSKGLREGLAKAVDALECARREYREALLLMAFGDSGSER